MSAESTDEHSEFHEDNEKDIPLMDPSTMQEVLQAINGQCSMGTSTAKERVIKRQRRGNRMKVYDNGYIFTYDKDSQCGQRSFWRCERKSECQARVHTNPSTNQIIKRINEHTHDPPSREDLPPWLVLSQTTSDTSDDGGNGNGRESTTGILINANYSSSSSSANAQLSNMVERELDASSPHKIEVKVMPEMIKEEPVDEDPTSSPPKKRKRVTKKEESALELLHSYPEQFWEILELTRKMIRLIQEGGSRMSMCVKNWKESNSLPYSTPERSIASSSSVVTEWFDSHNLGEYKQRFSKFSMDALRRLSSDDCVRICENEADALLLYHSLRISPCTEASSSSSSAPSSSSSLTVFIAERPTEGAEEDPLYQMISLQQKTPMELQSQMEERGLLQHGQTPRLCVVGPGGIKVELNGEILSSWSPESVFQFTINRGVCHLDRIS